MKRYHLKKPETYTQNGQEKTFWHEVGSLVIFDDGKGKVRIPAIELEAQAFPIEERTVANAPKVDPEPPADTTPKAPAQEPEEDIEIPF